MNNLEKLISLVKNKKVSLVCHWDCDGVTSGAIIYHLLKKHCEIIHTNSKGDIFQVEKKDTDKESEILICVDIPPSKEILDEKKCILIDHHPYEDLDKLHFNIYDKDVQSCSLLIYQNLLPDKEKVNSYFTFLALLGYFGDGGSNKDIPLELDIISNELIPDMLKKNKSYYSNDYYLEIEKFVSMMNVGKRSNWSGNVPFEMLKSTTNYKDITNFNHPLSRELLEYKEELKILYSKNYNLTDLGHMHLIEINCEKNIQGVICARFMKNKPIIVINKNTRGIMASIRSPDSSDIDVGTYLNQLSNKIPNLVAGGHEKAGGATINETNYEKFKEAISQEKF